VSKEASKHSIARRLTGFCLLTMKVRLLLTIYHNVRVYGQLLLAKVWLLEYYFHIVDYLCTGTSKRFEFSAVTDLIYFHCLKDGTRGKESNKCVSTFFAGCNTYRQICDPTFPLSLLCSILVYMITVTVVVVEGKALFPVMQCVLAHINSFYIPRSSPHNFIPSSVVACYSRFRALRLKSSIKSLRSL